MIILLELHMGKAFVAVAGMLHLPRFDYLPNYLLKADGVTGYRFILRQTVLSYFICRVALLYLFNLHSNQNTHTIVPLFPNNK